MNFAIHTRASRAAALCLLLLTYAACTSSKPPPEPERTPESLALDARVVYVPLEGGFYGLVAADGARYEPHGLTPELQRDGLHLRLRVEPLDRTSIRMWGRPVRILHAAPVE